MKGTRGVSPAGHESRNEREFLLMRDAARIVDRKWRQAMQQFLIISAHAAKSLA
jgi:hypothetical protein